MQDSELFILSDIAQEFGVSREYFRFLIFKKKLRAVKVGRNWYTSRSWCNDYFSTIQSRKALVLPNEIIRNAMKTAKNLK
jgi:hypothetical protein